MKYLSYVMMVLCACSLHAQRNISNTDGIVYSTPISVLDVMDMGTTGTITNAAGIGAGNVYVNAYGHVGSQSGPLLLRAGGVNSWGFGVVSGMMELTSGGSVGWNSAATLGVTKDLILYRDSAGTLAQRNGANAQISRIYGTYTDSSNYERLSLSHDGSGVGTIGVESGGSGSADQSLKLQVAGNGALYVDGDTAGSARGINAVDLQIFRSSSDHKAIGSYSSILGGQYNVASGIGSAVVGGGAGTASGYRSSVIAGELSISEGSHSSVVGGLYAKASLYGQHAYASGPFAGAGSAQGSRLVARNTTSGTTPADLFLDGSSAKLVLPNGTTWKFVAEISARSTDAGAGNEESAAYEISGLIERDSAAADTRIVGTPTVTTIAEDDAAWSVAASADTTSGALTITCTGNDETTVRWVTVVRLVEVGG